MSTDEERKILEDIKKTGYPLEVDVANWLIEKGWSVFPQYPYFDKQAKKIRAIDMVASHYGWAIMSGGLPRLIVECKKSEKPWIFYSVRPMHLEVPEKAKFVGFNELLLVSKAMRAFSLFQPYIDLKENQIGVRELTELIEKMRKLHFFREDLPIAHSCHVAFRKKKEDVPDDFQEAIYQLRGAYLEIAESPLRGPIFIAIVLRGKLFEFKKKNASIKLLPRDHILFSTMIMSHEGQELRDLIPPTIIDIVIDTYFLKYLDLLKNDMEICKEISELMEKMRK